MVWIYRKNILDLDMLQKNKENNFVNMLKLGLDFNIRWPNLDLILKSVIWWTLERFTKKIKFEIKNEFIAASGELRHSWS